MYDLEMLFSINVTIIFRCLHIKTMFIVTHNTSTLKISQDLQQFLLDCYQITSEKNSTQIASISLEIDLVDPLVILDKIVTSNQLNFYWENKSKNEAIIAVDAIAKLEFSGKDRFIKSEDFIKKHLNKIAFFNQNREISIPHFFCSFSFFDENIQVDYPFPAAMIFVPSWQVAVKNNRCILQLNTFINSGTNIQKICQNLHDKIEMLQSLKDEFRNVEHLPILSDRKIINDPTRFKNSVSSVLKKIRSHHLNKIVLADTLDVKSHQHFNLSKSLNNLRHLHPNCCVFSTSNGRGQNFIGASPERLISINQHQLITDALAGSAPRGNTPVEDAANANSLVNSVKERHEHSLVIEFITQRLTQLGLFPQVLAPRLRQLSNIQHLWTPISAIVPHHIHPLKIVSQLHPTPAVAGETRDVACDEIRCYENFERGLYAAPLGWIDAKGNCEFIVGIRSALIDGDRARLYAGAGIVAGSDPEKEFAEVQLKLQALLKALV